MKRWRSLPNSKRMIQVTRLSPIIALLLYTRIDRERETYKIYRRKVNGNDRKANWNWKNLVETVETEWNFGLDGSEAR